MPILRKLKSLLGADDADEESERDVTVTVEHDPENEAAVKGADVEGSETETASTASAPASESAASESAANGMEASAGDATTGRGDVDEATDESSDDDAADPVEIPDAEGGTADADAEADTDVDEDDADDATDAEADVDPAAEASGSDEPVDVLNGIGPAYAERLENAGVETVGQLAAADAATLSEDASIAEGRIQGWIDQAAEY